VTEPDEGPGWRVRIGTGLLAHTPMSDARREAFRKEEEREARAVEFEAEQRRQAALERRWELERQGVEAHTVADVLQRLSYAADRTDRIEARKEREAAEQLGHPEPRTTRWELKREQQAAAAKALIEPASKADVSKLTAAISQIKSKLSGRSESVSAGAERTQETPQEYTRNYGSSIHFRNGGGIVRGPY
jgi:hypothetical protein